MSHKRFVLCSATALLALAVACSKSPQSPASPSTTTEVAGDLGPDGSTLKVTAPTPQSPVSGAQPTTIVLVSGTSSALFPVAALPPLTYQFEVRNAAGATICTATGTPSGSTVAVTPVCTLDFDANYSWRVRAVLGSAFGPWSADASFRSPSGGFIRGNEVYDPLVNGKTVGEIVGPVTFIPGVGVRLEGFNSHIRYRLPQTLVKGEFSIIVTGMATNTEGDKTKVMAMSEGLDDLVTNDRRMTVEKRGDPEGIVAWRLITREDQVDTEGAEREFVRFDPNQSYLWTATWNGVFNLNVKRGGSTGTTIYNKGKAYQGPYDPDPHYAFIGAPVGRSGPTAATVPGMIVRQVWISSRPRPAGL
ncbi:MAG: hypothetical protein H0U19_09720 [Acidobacteria bacterium]|nr:hypothetical protein [Acidobacteriota bacterium]